MDKQAAASPPGEAGEAAVDELPNDVPIRTACVSVSVSESVSVRMSVRVSVV